MMIRSARSEAEVRFPDYLNAGDDTVDLEDVPQIQREAFEEGVEYASAHHEAQLEEIYESLDNILRDLYDGNNSPGSYA